MEADHVIVQAGDRVDAGVDQVDFELHSRVGGNPCVLKLDLQESQPARSFDVLGREVADDEFRLGIAMGVSGGVGIKEEATLVKTEYQVKTNISADLGLAVEPQCTAQRVDIEQGLSTEGFVDDHVERGGAASLREG